MEKNKEFNDDTISDIILCDPITMKGKEALYRLGLTTQEITASYFYKHLRAESKYDSDKEYNIKFPDSKYYGNCLYYQYTIDQEQFNLLKNRLIAFNTRFRSDIPNEYPLIMLGVAGNGKSIEINRKIREIIPGDNDFECGRAYLNLENSFTKKTYGSTYYCPDVNNSLWLFCIKLLDGIMQFVKNSHLISNIILENFNKYIKSNNLSNEKQNELFKNIGNYSKNNIKTETKVFDSLISLTESKDASRDIMTLLEILMWIMYCSNPNKKHYIVIDNIEQYIQLNKLRVQIPNSSIAVIYNSINLVITNITSDFNRIEENLAWKSFKIILVLRRTSLGLLIPARLHTPVKGDLNITDVTGYYQIPDIWKKKKKHILSEKTRNNFNGDIDSIVDIVDILMNDGEEALGTSYQSIIAPLMSYGIRRNAKSQAHAAYKTYKMLSSEDDTTINMDEFKKLISVANNDNPTVRYMFRRALIEFQFKWSIYGGKQERWEKLNLGHITEKKKIQYENRNLIIQNVDYDDIECVTLVRRILTYLSCFPDLNNKLENGRNKSVIEMFSTIPLYDLIKGVLVDPSGRHIITDKEYLQFSKVLIALSDMSNGDTKCAPYVILGINDITFHQSDFEETLATLLKKIYLAGKEESLPSHKYNCSDFGVRLTDAGHSFLLDWQASFSFISSLYCFTIPSLFFLKDISSIKYVIETVYNSSNNLCEKYEREAQRFCGNEITLKTATYLPRNNGEYLTFRRRVKELHIDHLNLYRAFIDKNYELLDISEQDKNSLTNRNSGFISKYISKYESWKINIGEKECF